MRSRWMVLPLGLLLPACSWGRFDDLEKDTPVVLLEKPKDMGASFGFSVAAARVADRSLVLVGGAPGENPAAMFNLGDGTAPTVDAIDTGSCTQGDDAADCYLADRPAALGTADVGGKTDEEGCFVLGVGKAAGSEEHGLIGRCLSAVEYTLPVPPAVLKKVIKDEVLLQDSPTPLVMATDRGKAPGLAAGARKQQVAWYYPPLETAPRQLVPPGDVDADFGATTAVVRVTASADDAAGPRVVAVGAREAGHVWLFDGASGAPVGCLGGPDGFGGALGSGRVDADDVDDLVVADDRNVTVFSGAAFAGLHPATDVQCTLAALPPGAVIASFGCGSRGSITGCAPGFASSIAVGDVDGDGDGEVMVGVPAMRVRGESRAGAVLVYDVEPEAPTALVDELFISSAAANDELGISVTTAQIAGRDVVVAGVPGAGHAAVFYCNGLLAAGQGGSRCP